MPAFKLLYSCASRDEALRNFEQALDLDSDNFVAYVGRGNLPSQEGRLAEAVAAYTTALKLQPDNDAIANNLNLPSTLWWPIKLPGVSAQSFALSDTLTAGGGANPQGAEQRYRIEGASSPYFRFNEADAEIIDRAGQRLLARSETDADALYDRNREQYSASIELLNRAIEVRPNSPEAYFLRGRRHFEIDWCSSEWCST